MFYGPGPALVQGHSDAGEERGHLGASDEAECRWNKASAP